MSEKEININFDINAKCQSMIEEANKIIKVYLETTNLYEEDGRYNLAYDVKNYLPKLQQENKQLKEDFKLLKELQMRTNEANQKYKEVIEEVRERIDIIKPIYKSYIWYNELERMLNKAKEVVKDE